MKDYRAKERLRSKSYDAMKDGSMKEWMRSKHHDVTKDDSAKDGMLYIQKCHENVTRMKRMFTFFYMNSNTTASVWVYCPCS